MKKTTSSIYAVLLIIIICLLQKSCKKEEENIPPTCTIISPDNGAEIEKGTSPTISVNADDTDGSITEVKFYIDDIGISSSSIRPYKYIWNTSDEKEGNHIIKATAKDNDGILESDEIEIIIKVPLPPVADFTADSTTVLMGETINFTDQSTNNPTSWLWDFGDGYTSTSQNPSYSYFIANKYTVSLKVSNYSGSDSISKKNYITVNHETGTVKDYEGNEYKTVKIGSQWWMAENLKSTKYKNGTSIPLVTDEETLCNMSTPAYCWYENSYSTYGKTYGALYNWYAVNTGNLCPSGWHVPSEDEWNRLEIYLGMDEDEVDDIGYRGSDEGAKMKETGTAHWYGDNSEATNESGFTALPGGMHVGSVACFFWYIGEIAIWWSSTESTSDDAWTRSLVDFYSTVYREDDNKNYNISVRCVKD